jgi:predicted RNase H-like nuclease
MQLRTELLAGQGFALGFLETKPPREAALDDFYDACACAWSANRILGREARVFPAEPDLDAEGWK